MAHLDDQRIVVAKDNEITLIEINEDSDIQGSTSPSQSVPSRQTPVIVNTSSRATQTVAPQCRHCKRLQSHRSTSQATPRWSTRSSLEFQSMFLVPSWDLNGPSSTGASRSQIPPPFLTTALSKTSSSIRRYDGTAQEPILLDEDDESPVTLNRSLLSTIESHDFRGRPLIVLDDDEEHDLSFSMSFEHSHDPGDHVIIDLDSLERENSQEADPAGIHVADAYRLSASEPPPVRRERPPPKIPVYPLRNPPIEPPFSSVEDCPYEGGKLRVGKTIELRRGSFVQITGIFRHAQTDEVKIRGHRLQRARDLNGFLDRKVNELAYCLEVDLDDPRPCSEQDLVEVSLVDIQKLRNLRATNHLFPEYRNLRERFLIGKSKEEIANDAGLTVRWRLTSVYESAHDRHKNQYKERMLMRLGPGECKGEFTIRNEVLRRQWRGETVRGGAWRPSVNAEEIMRGNVIDLTDTPVPAVDETDFMGPGNSAQNFTDEMITIDCEEQFHGSDKTAQRPVEVAEVSFSGSDYRRASSDQPANTRTRKRTWSNISEVLYDGEHIPKRVRRGTLPTRQVTQPRTTQIGSQRSSKSLSSESNEQLVCKTNSPQPEPTTNCSSHPIPALDKELIDLTTPDLLSPRPSLPQTIDSSPSPPPRGSISSSQPQHQPISRLPGQKLTYGDAFCGAGGTTRGAHMAGLHILWGFDNFPPACASWAANFPNADLYELHSGDFVEQAKYLQTATPGCMKVDILHLSPPCQYFSPAHTVNGPKDEMNVASLFAVQEVVKVCRPRVVTLEQTFGIACPRFRFYFRALVQMFTTLDFGIRWSIVQLSQWGLPARRNRLIIIASCPGEILPSIPSATHGEGTSQRLVSAKSQIDHLEDREDLEDHDLSKLSIFSQKRPSWDGSGILPKAMTCSGGQNYHYAGWRDLTLREFATLQGFPECHAFRGVAVKRQIGNAVPPCVAKVLFASIKKDLDRADGIVGPEVL